MDHILIGNFISFDVATTNDTFYKVCSTGNNLVHMATQYITTEDGCFAMEPVSEVNIVIKHSNLLSDWIKAKVYQESQSHLWIRFQ